MLQLQVGEHTLGPAGPCTPAAPGCPCGRQMSEMVDRLNVRALMSSSELHFRGHGGTRQTIHLGSSQQDKPPCMLQCRLCPLPETSLTLPALSSSEFEFLGVLLLLHLMLSLLFCPVLLEILLCPFGHLSPVP